MVDGKAEMRDVMARFSRLLHQCNETVEMPAIEDPVFTKRAWFFECLYEVKKLADECARVSNNFSGYQMKPGRVVALRFESELRELYYKGVKQAESIFDVLESYDEEMSFWADSERASGLLLTLNSLFRKALGSMTQSYVDLLKGSPEEESEEERELWSRSSC